MTLPKILFPIFILLLVTLLSCFSPLKTIIFKGKFYSVNGVLHRQKVYINVPKNGNLIKHDRFSGFYMEYRIVYPDKSIIYISMDFHDYNIPY